MPVSPGSYVLDYEQLTLKCLISVLKSPILWSKIFIFFTRHSKISLQRPLKYCIISTVQDALIRAEVYKTPFLGEKGKRG
jgi:predicted permease